MLQICTLHILRSLPTPPDQPDGNDDDDDDDDNDDIKGVVKGGTDDEVLQLMVLQLMLVVVGVR